MLKNPRPSAAPQGAPLITADSSYGAITVTSADVFVPSVSDVNCYNHGPRLYRLPGSSRIYMLWQQGPRNEDGGGVHITGVYSDDSGATWSAQFTAQTAFDADDITGNVMSHQCVIGDMVTFSGRSFLVGEVHEIAWAANVQTSRINIGNMAIEMTGGVFSAPKWITGSGGLSLSFWSADVLSGLLTGMSSPGYDGGGINTRGYPKIANGEPDNIIEGVVFNYADGWVRIGRGYNPTTGVSLSSFIYTQWSPTGVVWSREQASAIANAPALIAGIKMANGKYCIAWNPDSDRNKLVLAVGTNALNYGSSYSVRSGTGTTATFAGAYKGGGPQYSSIIERADGKLLVAYSIWKEKIAVSVVTVP